MSNHGYFVISLDFELYWGMFDKVTLREYGENIRGAHTAIPEMLSLFRQNGIHATWATVGMLMCEDKKTLLQNLPNPLLQPKYKDMRISAYVHLKKSPVGENAADDPYHFGAYLVEKITHTPHQELATHTFSHFYCIDGEDNSDAVFAADCNAFNNVSKQHLSPVTSIVFPRNQTTKKALELCMAFGLTAYRGTPRHFLYSSKKESEQSNLFLRALRLCDAYMNISGHHTYTLKEAKGSRLVNVQGSRFLRPYSVPLRFFEKLRIRRIKKSMTYAAQHNEVFHLWWHPHNFGVNRKENMRNLLELIEHFHTLQEKYGMQSATMREIATRANE